MAHGWSGAALAADDGATDREFSLHGFGTLGAVRSDTNQVNFVRDLSQRDGATDHWTGKVDSLLGVQAAYKLSPQFEAVAQATSRYRYDKSFRPEVSWAYLKYVPDSRVNIRAGRLGTEFLMLADSRLVGYSYLTVRPPGDYFWSLPFYYIDGADAALSLPVGNGVVLGKVFHGVSREKIPLADQTWDLDGSRMSGAYVDYQSGPWQARLGYARIHFKSDLPIGGVLTANLPPALVAPSARELRTAGTDSDYYSFGLVYDEGPWQVQLMLNSIDHGSQAFQNSQSGYVLAGYRVAAVIPYLGYSWVSSHTRGNASNPVVARIMADSHAQQRTSFVGVRWDFAANWAVKAQWDAIRGEADSIFPFRWEKPGWNGRADIFSATLDFVF